MRKMILALSAIAIVGFALPFASPANAEDTVVVKKSHHHDWDRHHHKTVVIKHRDHDHKDHD